jgi:hypothetical protein
VAQATTTHTGPDDGSRGSGPACRLPAGWPGSAGPRIFDEEPHAPVMSAGHRHYRAHLILPVSTKASRARLEEGMDLAGRPPQSLLRAWCPGQGKRWTAICPLGWRGQPGQCAAFRPAGCDIFTAHDAPGAGASAWPWCWRARQRDTAGTAGGRSPGGRARQPPRRRICVRRTRRKLPPRNGETPGEPRPPTAGHPGCSSLSTARARPRCSRLGAVRRGAPKVRP